MGIVLQGRTARPERRVTETGKVKDMACQDCAIECCCFGRKHSTGSQPYRCRLCLKTYSEPRRTVGDMCLPFDRTQGAVNVLVEGTSIRSAARITETDPPPVLALLAQVGRDCHHLFFTLPRARHRYQQPATTRVRPSTFPFPRQADPSGPGTRGGLSNEAGCRGRHWPSAADSARGPRDGSQ